MDNQWDQWCDLSASSSPTNPLTDISDGYFTASYMLNTNDTLLPDAPSQPSADFAYFSHQLDFTDSLSPGMASGISPAAYFGPTDTLDYYQGIPQPGGRAGPASTPRSQVCSEQASPARLRTSKIPSKRASAKASQSKTVTEENEKQSVSRESHNQVEKKYRDRLNDQFERLLATLATSSRGADSMDDDSQRPLSKSAVLLLARRQILALEKENSQLSTEVERLTGLLERTG